MFVLVERNRGTNIVFMLFSTHVSTVIPSECDTCLTGERSKRLGFYVVCFMIKHTYTESYNLQI